jgi:hypothetical protein
MAHLVEEGKLTLEDIRELEISLAKNRIRKSGSEASDTAGPAPRAATHGERRRKADQS